MLLPSYLRQGFRAVLGWIDARTDPPIMRRHVNDGSQEYFQHAQAHQGESEFDALFGSQRTDDDELDDEPSFIAGSVQEAEHEYRSMRGAALGAAVVFVVALVVLSGMHGIGWLARFESARITNRTLYGAVILIFAVSAFRCIQRGSSALRLRREIHTSQLQSGAAKQ